MGTCVSELVDILHLFATIHGSIPTFELYLKFASVYVCHVSNSRSQSLGIRNIDGLTDDKKITHFRNAKLEVLTIVTTKITDTPQITQFHTYAVLKRYKKTEITEVQRHEGGRRILLGDNASGGAVLLQLI